MIWMVWYDMDGMVWYGIWYGMVWYDMDGMVWLERA